MMVKTGVRTSANLATLMGRLSAAAKAGPQRDLRLLPAFLLALCLCLCGSAWAQTDTTQRSVKGAAGQDIRVGVYATIRSDCKSGPPPTIRLTKQPSHGQVTVKQGKLRTTNLKQCLVAEVPAFVVIYKSAPGFSGDDALTLEVINANGKTQVQNITINVGPNARGEKI